MRKLILQLKPRAIAFLLCFPFTILPPLAKEVPITINRGAVQVVDYPLPSLVQRLFEMGAEKVTYIEDIPNTKVKVNCAEGSFSSLLKCVGDSTGLVFQEVKYNGGVINTIGYIPGQVMSGSWLVCRNSLEAPPKGQFRIYEDPAINKYRIKANEVPVKTLIDWMHRLYGNTTFASELAHDLMNLGIDVADDKLKFAASLDLKSHKFDTPLRQQLVQSLYKAFLTQNETIGLDVWPLTYFDGRNTTLADNPGNASSGSTGSNTSNATSILKADDVLNAVLGPNTAKMSQQNVLISGTAETRLKAKRILAFLDTPLPQVQMNMWAIQISGKPERVGPRLKLIKKAISLTQGAMTEAQSELNTVLEARGAECTGNCEEVLKRLKGDNIGFTREFNDALSLNEALILLAIHPKRKELVKDYQLSLKKIQSSLSERLMAACQEQGLCQDKNGSVAVYSEPKLTRMNNHFLNETQPQVVRAINKLIDALSHFQNSPDNSQAPSVLQRESAVIDRLLKSAIDAYTADMEEAFLDPLLARLEHVNGGSGRVRWGDEGVALTGKTRIVVTSRNSSLLEPVTKSYVNISRPKPLGQDFLNKAFPNNLDGKATPRVPLLDLEAFPALLLAAGLTEEKPVFSEVAPGVKISVRPTVIPDGTAARLELDCTFGVTTSILGNQENVWGQTKADAVERHHVSTDATVSVFDLFDISSFSFDTSHPQAPFFVPVLGRLPIVGPAFQWPRDKKRAHHESIILVNTVVLPRALDLARHYNN